MLSTKVINAGILKLTKSKQEALDNEYNGFQWWMQFNIDKDILSQLGINYDIYIKKYI